MDAGALFAAYASLPGAPSLRKRLKRLTDQQNKSKCVKCGVEIGPGRAGRKCKECREQVS